ncbi:MAG: hypothetical protein COX79_02010 [Candidatus Levybacteria bacterium CG_4_10_14_0_2_um_filter_36_16]|nr:MAG: hypothetical protein AUK12_02565 [Candidatus Levybacteria bacterium CG2_30_37_29]PIR79048.1 MAG: hypothetical protein COU26_03285 [Candidatus Levybacteria bacterium CG10_big_fil_rev_8_21_14_0_10_36_30]PIZ97506.1 MAG: hypothetical protein COX79_02010 [Candidatus Levybacteria bacterium CG_4_10_14_0_2_um_filter_36_16]PJA90462.1 MAG: hypothetical protein CO136_02050 [Candidatus Levybacteria bacterium CG_4_9_14_3_um_filter_36_7]
MKRRLVVLGVFISVIALVAYILEKPSVARLSQKEKEAALTKLLGRKVNLNEKNVPKGNVEFRGKYISFWYPKKAIKYEKTDPSFASSSALLDFLSFDIKEPRTIFNMVVVKNDANIQTIDDDPGVMLRRNSTSYKESKIIAGGLEWKVYEKKESQQSEKTAFLLHKNRLYSIAILCNDIEELQVLFGDILRSVKIF